MLPPAETAGPAEPDAAEATDDGSSCTAAVAGLGVSAAIGLAPTVVRAGLADEVALLEAVRGGNRMGAFCTSI